jgi:putative CocE/NonD family hydrolase
MPPAAGHQLQALGAHLRCHPGSPAGLSGGLQRRPAAAAPQPSGTTAPGTPTCEITEVAVPMADGVSLAADLYMPRREQQQGQQQGSSSASDTSSEPLPVLLEYIPYRKTESRGSRFDLYSYFVERGFVVARVDIRGTGNSEGRVIPHEYSDIELDDGVVLIAWLAAQDWSNGNVGMFGISWGGFNSIQLVCCLPRLAMRSLIHPCAAAAANATAAAGAADADTAAAAAAAAAADANFVWLPA